MFLACHVRFSEWMDKTADVDVEKSIFPEIQIPSQIFVVFLNFMTMNIRLNSQMWFDFKSFIKKIDKETSLL